jgi:hypothetical protein
MKIAKYQSVDMDYTFFSEDLYEGRSGYLRLTEFADVEFVPLPAADMVPRQIEILDNKIEAIQGRALAEINELKQKKQELLALTSGVSA